MILLQITLSLIICSKQCAISLVSGSDFFELTTQPDFVDKTDLLTHLFSNVAYLPRPRVAWNYTTSNYFFITCPRGFGKTTNLKMIQSFAQYELGADNTSKPWNETKAYEIFGKLKISQNEQIMRDNLAQYAVMYLDLTFSVDDLANEYNAANALWNKMADIFRPYEWYMKNVAQELAQTFLLNLVDGQMDQDRIHRTVFYVGKTLNRIGGKGALFLIDNFDSAARLAVSTPGLSGVPGLYKLVHKLIFEFTRFIRSENAEHRRSMSLLTGVSDMRFHDEEFNTSTIYRRSVFLENGTFSPYFGFTQQEVDVLMDKFNCSTDEKSDVQDYYKGYKTDKGQIYLYNPISITEYLESKQKSGAGNLQPYWVRNESLEFVTEFAKASSFSAKLTELISKNMTAVQSSILAQNSVSLISFFDGQVRNYDNFDDSEGVVLLLRYFYECGFLRHNDEKPWYEFQFANKEVRTEITQRFQNQLNCSSAGG